MILEANIKCRFLPKHVLLVFLGCSWTVDTRLPAQPVPVKHIFPLKSPSLHLPGHLLFSTGEACFSRGRGRGPHLGQCHRGQKSEGKSPETEERNFSALRVPGEHVGAVPDTSRSVAFLGSWDTKVLRSEAGGDWPLSTREQAHPFPDGQQRVPLLPAAPARVRAGLSELPSPWRGGLRTQGLLGSRDGVW